MTGARRSQLMSDFSGLDEFLTLRLKMMLNRRVRRLVVFTDCNELFLYPDWYLRPCTAIGRKGSTADSSAPGTGGR